MEIQRSGSKPSAKGSAEFFTGSVRIDPLVLQGAIDPGKVFDLTLPLRDVAEGYRAMDERRAIKALLQPE